MSLLIVGQTAAIYLFLVVALSRLGRSHRTELTPDRYMMIALLGSAVETGLYRGSGSMFAGLASAATLIAADRALDAVADRWPRVRRWLAGTPVVLIHDGQVIWRHLRQAHLTEDDLRAALRQRGYDDVGNVRLAILELDGSVGVIPQPRKNVGSSP